MKGLKRKFRRGLAGFLSFALTMTSFNMVSWADVTAAFENEKATFIMSGEDLRESAQAAIDSGSEFDFENLGLESSDKSLAKEYERLFTNGSVYEIAPTYDMAEEESADGAELRLFVRVNDAYEGYQLTGEEEIIFLYVNDSESRVTFRSLIDGYYTQKVTVKGNSTLFETDTPVKDGNAAGGNGPAGPAGENKNPEETTAAPEETTPAVPGETTGTEETPAAPGETTGTEETPVAPGETTGTEETPAAPGETTGTEETPAAPGETTGTEETTTAAPGETTGTEETTAAAPGETTGTEETTAAAPGETTGTEETTAAAPEETKGTEETAAAPEETKGTEETAAAPEETKGTEETAAAPEETKGTEETAAAPEETKEEAAPEPEKTVASISRNRTHILTTSDSDIQDATSEASAEETPAEEEETEENNNDPADVPTEDPALSASEEETEETTAEEVTTEDENSESASDESTAATEESSAAADESTAATDESTATADESTAAADETTAATDETTVNVESSENEIGAPAADPSNDMAETEEEEDAIKGTTSGRAYGLVILDESYYAKAYVTTLNKLNVDVSEAGYAVTYTVTPVGSATVTGARNVVGGNDLTFTVKPHVGYVIESVTANGENLVADEAAADEPGVDAKVKSFTVSGVNDEQEIVVSMAETGEHPEFNFTKTLGDVVVTLHAEQGILPAGTVAKITEVTEKVEEAVKEKTAEETGEDTSGDKVLAYDIKLYVENEAGELEELDNSWSGIDKYVEVTFSGKAIEENLAEADKVEFSHVDTGDVDMTSDEVDKITKEEVQGVESVPEMTDIPEEKLDKEVGLAARHFSTYAIVFKADGAPKVMIKTVDLNKNNIGGSYYDKGNANRFTFGEKNQSMTIELIKSKVSVPDDYEFMRATVGENYKDDNATVVKLKRFGSSIKYLPINERDQDRNYEEIDSKNDIYLWYTRKNPVISAKVYSRYDGLLDKALLNTAQGAGHYGPAGNDTPYVTVDINVSELEAKLREDYPDFKIYYNGSSHQYFSVANEGIPEEGGYEATVRNLYTKYIYECMTEESQNKIKGVLGDQYYGYVLKKENTGWHLDGYFGDKYLMEIYFANEGKSDPEVSHSTEQPERYSYVTDYIERKVGTEIDWRNVEASGQVGTYVKDGISYQVNITFGLKEYPITVNGEEDTVDYYRIDQTQASKYLAIFTYSIVKMENDNPDTPTITVSKIFDGLTKTEIEDLNQKGYQINLNGGDVPGTAKLKLADGKVTATENDKKFIYTWTINNLYAGTYNVSETGENYSGYNVTTTYNGLKSGNSVTTKDAEMKFTSVEITLNCNKNDYNVGQVDLIVAKLTQAEGFFVWSDDRLTGGERQKVIELINSNRTQGFNQATISNCYFFSGDNIKDKDGLTFRNATIKYDGKNTMHFDLPQQWSKFFTADYTIENPEDAEITIENTYEKQVGHITVIKNVTVNGNEPAGTRADGTYFFALYDSTGENRVENQDVKSITITNGRTASVTFTNVPIGNYKVYEVTVNDDVVTKGAPSGMTVSPANGREVTVPKNDWANIKFTNNKMEGSVQITKTDASGKVVLPGAKFQLSVEKDGEYEPVSNVQGGIYTTDENGVIAINGLEFGNYKLVEIEAPQGYQLSNPAWKAEFTVNDQKDHQAFTFEITNEKVKGYAKITKTFSDEETLTSDEKKELLKKVEIGVYSKNDGSLVEKVKPGDNGVVTVGPLEYGNYYFKEIAGPDSYLLNKDKVEFSITGSSGESNPVDAGTIENTRVKAFVTFNKTEAVGDGATKPLAGAVFELYREATEGDDISIDDYTSDANGVVMANGLETGTYYFIEKDLAGYQKNEARYYFQITRDDHGKTVSTLHENSVTGTPVTEVVNIRSLGEVSIVKVDEDGKPLAGAEFTLYAKKAEKSGALDTLVKAVKNLVGIDDTYEKYGENPYSVDKDGKLTIPNLPWNEYILVETKAPDGYVLSENEADRTHEFVVDRENIALKKTIKNIRIKGSVTLTKRNAENNAVTLDGAKFSLYKADGTPVEQDLTTVGGTFTVKNLDAGKYYFVETEAPKGYEIQQENGSAKKYWFTINQASITEPVKVTADNDRIPGYVVIYKTDSESGQGLEGATFELSRVESKLFNLVKTTDSVGTYKTDGNGRLEIKDLAWGTYELKETKAPEGYKITNGKAMRFTIDADHLQYGSDDLQDRIVITNDKVAGSIQLVKKDQEDKAVEGARFELYRKSKADTTGDVGILNPVDKKIGDYTTDQDGQITVTELPWGTYYFVEVGAPEGYAITNARTADVTIQASNAEGSVTKPLVVNAVNTKIYGSVKLTKVGENGERLTGAEFDLYSYTKAADGSAINPVLVSHHRVSDNGADIGTLTVNNLPYGNYYFKETVAPDNYNLSENEKFFAITENGQQVDMSFVNTLIKADVRFQKVDTADGASGLNGAVFGLYKEETEGNYALISEYTSQTVVNDSGVEEDGVVLAEGLGAGDYYFVETTAPAGYELDATHHEFTIAADDNGTTITLPAVSNTRKTGSVVLTKYMSETELKLNGAVYNLYQMTGESPNTEEDTLIRENMTTGEDGTITADGLAWGEYYFVEQSAPDGYTMDQTPIRFTVNAAADFENGQSVVGENNRIAGTVNIEKVSSEDRTEKVEGVQFELRLQGETEVAATLITDAQGKATADNLAWGTYTLTEKQPADGFIPESEPRTITIDAEHLTVNLTGDAAITNTPIRGNVKVVKKDAEDENRLLAGAEFELYRKGDDTEPVGTLVTNEKGEAVSDSLRYGNYYLKETKAPAGYVLPDNTALENRYEFSVSENDVTVEIPVLNERQLGSANAVKTDENGSLLEGAVFTLYSSKDHRDSGFIAAIRAALNDGYYEYGTYTTDQTGQINMEALPWDTYYLKETTPPKGYAMSDTEYPFTIDDTHLEVNVRNIVNEALKGSVQLTKTAAGEGNQPLAGAEFELFRNTGDGTSEKVELDQALLTTDVSGMIRLTDLAWGEYYFKEVKAPTGYALNPAEVGFAITRDNVAASIEAPIGVTITDTAFDIAVDKVDAETKDSLTGAELKLYRLEDVTAGKPAEGAVPVAEWNSVAGRPQDIGSLVDGGAQYVLIETKAPAGYTVAENLVFTVGVDGTIETEGVVTEGNTILVQDVKYAPGTLTITAGKELAGRSMKDGEFEFALRDGDNTIATAVNRADGSVTFNLTDYYKEVGEYDYTVVEVNNGLSGITYDEQSYAVHVSVTDNGDGSLAVKATYPNDGDAIVFKNAYHAAGSLTVSGTKQMTGREFKPGDEYTFELLRNNEVVDTTTIRPESGNSAAFVLTDKSLDETDSKMTYTYEVREVNGGQTIGGVTYDDASYKAEYRIVDNADGTVSAERIGGADLSAVTFTNEYRTGGAAFTINGSKHMTGRSFRAGDEFTFTATKDGQTYDSVTIKPESGNDAAFAFKADAYTMADAGKTYKYTVYEEKGTISRVTYSSVVYEITVTVADDGTGNLNVSAVSDGKAFTKAEFVNSYSAPDDSGSGGGGGGGGGGGNPDANRPYVPGGPGDTTVTIDPGAVPLANLPTDGSPTDNLILIDDGNVPLAGLPKTGDRAAHAGLAALLSGFLLAAFAALNSRKKEDENR